MLLTLGALALGTLWLRRRIGRLPDLAGAGRGIGVLETVRLSESQKLSIVRYGDRELLVAHGAQSATLLAGRATDQNAGATGAASS